jgi:hypothetical protein
LPLRRLRRLALREPRLDATVRFGGLALNNASRPGKEVSAPRFGKRITLSDMQSLKSFGRSSVAHEEDGELVLLKMIVLPHAPGCSEEDVSSHPVPSPGESSYHYQPGCSDVAGYGIG